MIRWDEKLSVGVAQFDEHHRELIRIINEIESARAGGEDYHYLKNLLFELVSYTKYHFSAEERIMAKHNYPDAEPHLHEHKKLVRQVERFLEEYSEHKPALADEVHEFLKRWLIEHILETDRAMGEYLTRRGVQ
jgi:hemerythrin